MSERIFTLMLFVFGAVYLLLGLRLEAPFAYDPLGPETFPVFLGTALLVLCLLIGLRATMSSFMMIGRVKKLVLAIFFYLLSFQILGFMLATTITVYLVARLFSCSWMQALLTGLIMSICFYGLFHFVFGMPLPLGDLFRLGG